MLVIMGMLATKIIIRADRSHQSLNQVVNFEEVRSLLLKNIDCNRTKQEYTGTLASCSDDLDLWSNSRKIVPKAGKAIGPYHYRARCGTFAGNWRIGVEWIRYKKNSTTPYTYRSKTREGGIVWGTKTSNMTSTWTELYPTFSLCDSTPLLTGSTSPGECSTGEIVVGLNADGSLNCKGIAAVCGSGEMVTAVGPDGSVSCSPIPGVGSPPCPAGQVIRGFNSDLSLDCVTP